MIDAWVLRPVRKSDPIKTPEPPRKLLLKRLLFEGLASASAERQ